MPIWIYIFFGGLIVAFVLFGLLWWWNQRQLQKPRERWDRFARNLRSEEGESESSDSDSISFR